MTVAHIDNSIDEEIRRSITWQYDNAEKLIALISSFKDFYNQSTGEFWNSFAGRVNLADPEKCDDFGLKIWGDLLSVTRPILEVEGVEVLMSTDLYRRILLSRLRLLQKDATLPNLVNYVNDIFGIGNIIATDNHDMSVSFEIADDNDLNDEEIAAFEQKWNEIMYWPAGVTGDNTKSTSPMFWLSETGSRATSPIFGGLDNSSLNWNHISEE